MQSKTLKNKKINEPTVSEPMPLAIQIIALLMIMMIPALGYFILRSDPVIYSNNVEKTESTVQQVQKFASFIETQPQLVQSEEQRAIPKENSELPPVESVRVREQSLESAKESVRELEDLWRQNPPQYDQQWRLQVAKLFEIAEKSGSEEALDLIQKQMLAGRAHSDDLNREASNQWFSKYIQLEKRADKLRESSEFFKEQVLKRVDEDERIFIENQSR